MRNLILAAGVAALAIAAPAAAKPDKQGGGDRAQVQKRSGGAQKAQRGGARKTQAQRVERRGGGERRTVKAERRGGERQAQRLERRGGGERRLATAERGERKAQRVERRASNERRFANLQSDRNERRAQRAEKRPDRDVARVDNRNRRDDRIERRTREQRVEQVALDRRDVRNRADVRRDGREIVRVRAFDGDRRDAFRDRDDFRRVARWRDWNDGDWDRNYGLRGIPAAYVGCPPGLAKKSPSCVPPGQARNAFIGRALPTYYSSNALPLSLRDIYRDNDDYYHRWGDGYVYRVNRTNNLVAALLPLIGAGYGVGQYFPYANQPSYYVPSYYQPFYQDYGDDYYRYANGYVYEIDGRSGLVEDVIPLLDRGYGYGQLMPASYSYYNVPYQYRSMYYDTPDQYYRYAPGAIYQVDPQTRLITAIASLLTGGLSVGQPLPQSYSAYNVPLGFRDQYYDRPDAWYRYSDGYIYQVDPTSQLITAIVRSIV